MPFLDIRGLKKRFFKAHSDKIDCDGDDVHCKHCPPSTGRGSTSFSCVNTEISMCCPQRRRAGAFVSVHKRHSLCCCGGFRCTVRGSLGFMYWNSMYTCTCSSWTAISCFASHLCAALSTVGLQTHARAHTHAPSAFPSPLCSRYTFDCYFTTLYSVFMFI